MPQPIDMQSEINRVTMAERMQDASTRASLVAQHRAQLESEEQDRIRDTQVNETEETSQSPVDKDGRKKGSYGQSKKKKKPKTPGSEAAHVLYTSHETKHVVTDPDDHDLDVTV